MISSRPAKYQLEFCYPHNYAAFVRAVKNKTSIARVGFIGIENLRIFVCISRGRVQVEPYIKEGNTWQLYTKSVKLETPDVKRMLHSAQEFESELCRVFFKAFPKAEESFFDNMPCYKEVLSQLQHSSSPSVVQLDELKLVYTTEDMETIDDADGYVSIMCDDGTLCIPFDDRGGEYTLQLYRAKFHPDARLVSAFNGTFEWLEDLWSRLSSITLNGVLNRIDNLVK